MALTIFNIYTFDERFIRNDARNKFLTRGLNFVIMMPNLNRRRYAGYLRSNVYFCAEFYPQWTIGSLLDSCLRYLLEFGYDFHEKKLFP